MTNPAVSDVVVLQVWLCEVFFNRRQITSKHSHSDFHRSNESLDFVLLCFLVLSICSRFWQSPSPTLAPLGTSRSRHHAEEEKSVPGFVCCGSGPAAARAEPRCEVHRFLSAGRKEAAAAGKSGSFLFLLVSVFSSRHWPLSQWAAKSPKLTG